MGAFVHAVSVLGRNSSSTVPGLAKCTSSLRPRLSVGSTSFTGSASSATVLLANRRPLKTSTPAMQVAKDGDRVEVHYTGMLEDGSEFDSSRKRGIPISFTIGGGQVIPGFDDAVRGLSIGESRRSVIPPERGYGTYNEEMVLSIPRKTVPSSMALEKGSKVPLSNGAMATVLECDDAEIKIDANHKLAGKTLTFDMELVDIVEPVLRPPAEGLDRFICAAGCFWGVELAFQRAEGVVSTRVGYTHGQKENPTYREVCSGDTGHTEGVAVDFDPKQTTYENLLDLFWERLGKSALTKNRAGNDVGTQYRSGIYYLNDEQKKAAEESAKAASERFGKPVVTEVLSAEGKPFWLAEEYVSCNLRGPSSTTRYLPACGFPDAQFERTLSLA